MRAVVRFVRWLRSRSPLYQTRWPLRTLVLFLERHLVVAARREAHGVAEAAADAVGRSGRCAAVRYVPRRGTPGGAVSARQRHVTAALGRAAFGAHGLHLVTANLHGWGPVMRRACLPFVTVVSLLLTVPSPRPAAGQIRPLGQNPGDETPPLVELMAPVGDVTVQYPLITIGWCDGQTALDAASRSIRVNGQLRTASFSYTAGGWGGDCAGDDATSSTTTVALNVGSNTIRARICDVWQNCTTREWIVNRAVAGPPLVTLKHQHGGHVDRSLCLTLGAGEGAAIQCGDLVVVHGLPGYRTMGRERSLTLAYNSATAVPRPLVAAEVTQSAAPASVKAELFTYTVSGWVKQAEATYGGWGGGTRQLALAFDASGLPTAIDSFELRVTNQFAGGGAYADTVRGALLIVNRTGSEFGSGWHPVGVERLVPGQSGSRILWVGGDGSAVVYDPAGANTWVAAPGTFRDTIALDGPYYTRTLRHGARVLFDSTGRHVQTVARTGQVTAFAWSTVNGAPRLVSITVPPAGVGATTYHLHYSGAQARLDSITDPASRRLWARMDGNGRTYVIQDPDGHEVGYGYDATGRLLYRTNRRGYTTYYEYAHGLRVTRVSVPMTAGDTVITGIEHWDEKGLAIGLQGSGFTAANPAATYTRVYGPRAGVADDATFWIDRWGAPTSITDPRGHVTSIRRESSSAPALATRIQYPNGRIVGVGYDTRGNLLWVADSTHDGTGASTVARTDYTYGDADAPDSPRMIATPVDTTRFGFNTSGLVDTVWEQGGARKRFEYYGGNAAGLVYRYHEDSVTVVSTGNWSRATQTVTNTLTYDGWGNPATSASHLGNVTRYFADSYRRVDSVIDPAGHVTRYRFNVMNRVDSVGQVDGGATFWTRYYYTPTGRVERVVDPLGATRRWAYDGAEHPVSMWDGFEHEERRVFDRGGLLQSVVDRDGYTIAHAYDPAGNRLTTTYPQNNFYAPAVTIPGGTITHTYDAMNRDSVVTGPAGTVTLTYHREGTVKSERQLIVVGGETKSDVTLRYWYDRGNRRTKFFNGTDTLRYTYGVDGRLGELRVDWHPAVGGSDVFGYAWDARGNRDRITYPNGATVTFGYDADGRQRLVCSVHPGGALLDYLDHRVRHLVVDADGQVVESEQWGGGYDNGSCAGNPQASALVVLHTGPAAYAYDARHQLTRDDRFLYRYDAGGSRVSRRWRTTQALADSLVYFDSTHVLASRLQDPVVTDYTYDWSGNRWSEIPRQGGQGLPGTRYHFFNTLGQLVGDSSYLAYGAGLLDSTPYSYLQWTGGRHRCDYDGLGRATRPCGGFWTVYDGDTPVRLTGAGNVALWRFVHGPGLDDPLVAVEQQGPYAVKYYYLTDGTGRQLAFTAPDGDTRQEDVAYVQNGGNQAGAIERSTTFNHARMETESAAGLSYYRNRYYDQITGQFLQEDPIGIAGGVNLYQYAGNNPAAYTDPFGLCPIPPSSCVGRQGADLGVGSVPVASTIHDAVTAVIGRNIVTGEHVGLGGRALAAAGALTPVSGGQLRGAGRILGQLVERLGRPLTDAIQNGVRRVEFQLGDGAKLVFRGPETHAISAGGPQVRHYNVEVHEPTGAPGRFTRTENTHIDEEGRVIRP